MRMNEKCPSGGNGRRLVIVVPLSVAPHCD
jgi:hypothetical protein